ncbi:hypothetical protein [Neobacillus cucumis]|uniref:hypothetical protein n=1 Tax=Neobacillus cucumis TaxID=1740721 RepID=UPI0019639A5C|nr:hypothetical protein [Neobacillus cucumis]MBM7656223.1 hypothetical protein [Neobacillus cucumis]
MSDKFFQHERDKAWLRALLHRGIDEELLKKVMFGIGYENPDASIQDIYRFFHREHMRTLNEKLSKEDKRLIFEDLKKDGYFDSKKGDD